MKGVGKCGYYRIWTENREQEEEEARKEEAKKKVKKEVHISFCFWQLKLAFYMVYTCPLYHGHFQRHFISDIQVLCQYM